ncbi:tRNA preQ1(34) S-adenosylmethionine ribosyltransferase-isomerase QueA [Gammaproteobacteria bacterium]|nr:tRNA preQ1(34) S-adenosylmethionine ribosyltransferase-isomerase QueA [Gammaproteobacteria bacterium]
MKTEKFNYDLPEHLIAQYPSKNRVDSRLLVCIDEIKHQHFKDLPSYMEEGDLLVVNQTSVIPARLFGEKSTGGKVEIFLERFLTSQQTLVQIKSSRAPKEQAKLMFFYDAKEFSAIVIGRQDNFFILDWSLDPHDIFESYGEIPLPPYMQRSAETIDKERYETIYANSERKESVAAPTAGMHFDAQLLEEIQSKGVNLGYVNLQVGAGTFQPVQAEVITDHQIHKELIEVDAHLIEQVKETKARGGRIIAVGTTSVRALEAACQKGLQPFSGETQLFIYPGYKFKVVDLMITNFHLPKSSLLMLVAAFIGYEKMIDLYQLAVDQEYRFLSYGDAMLLKKHEI